MVEFAISIQKTCFILFCFPSATHAVDLQRGDKYIKNAMLSLSQHLFFAVYAHLQVVQHRCIFSSRPVVSENLARKRAGGGSFGFWLRLCLAVLFLAIPVIAGLSGPSIAKNAWRGFWRGVHVATGVQPALSDRENGQQTADKPLSGQKIDFGTLNASIFNPITRARLRVEFDIEGIAACDDPTAAKTIKSKYRFIREQAVIAVRNSGAAELEDERLRLLRRRILIRINRSLERPLFKIGLDFPVQIVRNVARNGFNRRREKISPFERAVIPRLPTRISCSLALFQLNDLPPLRLSCRRSAH